MITSSVQQPSASDNPVAQSTPPNAVTVSGLVNDLRSIWTGHNTPTDIWFRPMPEEHFQLLAERLLNKFIMINRDDVKKESMLTWMQTVDAQLHNIGTVLADKLGYIDPNAPDPKVEWARGVDAMLESLSESQAILSQNQVDMSQNQTNMSQNQADMMTILNTLQANQELILEKLED